MKNRDFGLLLNTPDTISPIYNLFTNYLHKDNKMKNETNKMDVKNIINWLNYIYNQ